MDVTQFHRSVTAEAPPEGLDTALAALWQAAHGDWHAAHELVQQDEGADAAWVHAYLHRFEGDLDNAKYWYRRAGRTPTSGPLPTEWTEIAAALLRRR